MALSNTYRARILSYLSEDTRALYEAGEYTDADLLQMARDAGIPDPARDKRPSEASRRSSTPSRAELEADKRRQQQAQAQRRSLEDPSAPGLSEAARRPRRGGGNPVPAIMGAVDSVLGGAQQEIGAYRYTTADKAPSLEESSSYFNPMTGRPYSGKAGGMSDEERERVKREAAEQITSGEQRLKAVDERISTIENPFAQFVTQAGSDFLRNPVSTVASVPGGPFAAIPAAAAYNQEYARARMQGQSPEAAHKRASVMSGIEFGISAIPAGRVGKAAVGREVLDTASERILGDALKTGAKESVSEGATTLAQAGANELFANYGTAEERQYAASQRSLDLWQDVRRSMAAGGLGGAGVQGTASGFQMAYEAGQRTRAMEAGDAANGGAIREADRARKEAERAEIERDLAEARARDEEIKRRIEEAQNRNVEIVRQRNAAEIEQKLQNASDESLYRQEQEAARKASIDEAFAAREQELQAQKQAEEDAAYAGTIVAPPADNIMANALANAGITPGSIAAPRIQQEKAQAAQVQQQEQAARDAAMAKAREEAAKQIAKEQKAALDKAKTKRAADRRKAITGILNDTANLPADQRTDEVARRTLEWDQANPVPTAETLPPTRAAEPQAQPAPVQEDNPAPMVKQALDEANANPDEDIDLDIEEDTKRRGMTEEDIRKAAFEFKSTPPSGKKFKPSTANDIKAWLKANITKSREAAAVARLIASGRLVLLDSSDQWYTGKFAGLYDGNRMYLAADDVDVNNLKAEIISIAAHEAKHAGDFSDIAVEGKRGDLTPWYRNKEELGKRRIIPYFKNFVGQDANRAMIQKIEASNDPIAKRAIEAVNEEAQGDSWVYENEVPTYYLTYALQSDKGMPGLARDAVSAVRTAIRAKLGMDVDIKDIAYMSRKLLEQVAISEQSLTKTVPMDRPLNMIIGERHPKFQEQVDKGLGYVDPIDNKAKAVIADAGRFVMAPVAFNSVGEMPLTELADISYLLEGYPELADIKVKLVNNTKHNGRYDHANKTIELKTTVPFFQQDGIILHEIQHAIQALEGHAYGASPSMFMDAELLDRERFTTARKRGMSELATKLGNLALQEVSMTPEDRQEIELYLSGDWLGPLTEPDAAMELGITLRGIGSAFVHKYGKAIDDLINTAQGIKDHKSKWDAAYAKAFEMYENVQGEIDARLTQQNKRTTEQQYIDAMANGMKWWGYADAVYAPPPKKKGTLTLSYPANTSNPGANPDSVGSSNLAVQGFKSVANRPEVNKTADAAERAVISAKVVLGNSKWADAVRTILGQFSGFGVLGRALGTLKELAEGEAASIAYVAEGNYHRVNGAIQKYAEKHGMTVKAAHDKLSKLFEEASRIEDPKRREALIARYTRNNPELRPIMDALNDISQRSKEIVQERAKDPAPFTDEEKLKYGAILRNRYSYFTRTYAAFQGKQGKARNENLLNEWKIAKKLKEKGKALPTSYANSFNTYERAVKFIIENDIAVFDPEMLAAQKIDRIKYLYEMWVGNPETLKQRIKNDTTIKGHNAKQKALRAAMEEAIAAVGPTIDADRIRREAEWVVNGMLGMHEASNPVITYYRGFKEDTGILQKRESVPEEIRQLFGEVDDLATRVAITLAKQGELVARMRMLREIREQGEGKWYVTPETFRSSDEYSTFTEELSGDQWGPLNGMRVKPVIAAAINDGLDLFTPLSQALSQSHASVDRAVEASSSKVVGGVRAMASLSKYANIVLDVANTWINLIGSGAILMQNAVIRPDDMRRAAEAAIAMIGDQAVPGRIDVLGLKRDPLQRNADLELFLRYGLLDSAVGQELRSTPTKMLKELVMAINDDSTAAGIRKAWHKVAKGAGRAKGAVTEAFALSDAWVKPAIFLSRLRFLEKVNQAEGNNWTQEHMQRMAADMTKDTTITFQRAAPIVKMVERVPLAQYAPYMQGVFRSAMYAYSQAFKDLVAATNAKTEEGKALYAMEGMRRLAGAASATIGMAFLTRGIQSFLNEDDDEEKIEAASKFLFQDFRYGHPMYLGKDAKDNPVFFSLSRFDPLGPANDMLRILMSDDEPAKKRQAIVEHMQDLWIKPRILTDTFNLGRAMFSDNEDVKNKKGKIERVFPTLTNYLKGVVDTIPGLDYEDGEAVVQLIDGLTPGMFDALDSDNPWPTSAQDTPEKIAAMTLLYTGGRLQAADPERAAFMAGNNLEKFQREGRQVINEALDVRGADAALERFYELRDGEVMRYERLREVYNAMLDYGYTPSKAMKIMRDNKVQAQDIAMIMSDRGIVGTGLMNVESVVKAGELADRNLPADERKRRAKERKDKMRILMQLLDKETPNE